MYIFFEIFNQYRQFHLKLIWKYTQCCNAMDFAWSLYGQEINIAHKMHRNTNGNAEENKNLFV